MIRAQELFGEIHGVLCNEGDRDYVRRALVALWIKITKYLLDQGVPREDLVDWAQNQFQGD